MATADSWLTALRAGIKHLKTNDPILAEVITRYPEPTFKPHQNYYQALVDAIISQQLSVKAAASIERRFQALFGGVFPTPEQILATDHEALRSVGLSRAKATYIQDLALHILDQKLLIGRLPSLSNEEIIRELVAVKGIGEWTAHMFLIFSLGRLDVLAVGDLGIKNSIQKLYGLAEAPTPDNIQTIAEQHNWHPYESLACWYLWQALDNKPEITTEQSA